MSNSFKWMLGRQNKVDGTPGYFKMKLAEVAWPRVFSRKRSATNRGGFDVYLLKYEPGFFLPLHTDPVPSPLRHYRLNIVFSGAGVFECDKTIFNIFNRVILFRPDLHAHSMQNGGKIRRILSIGWAI
jgi:hypothetical protein